MAGTAFEEKCPVGTYNPSRGGESRETACLPCDPGKYCNSTALTEPTGNYYRPPTKLREGNVFTGFFHSVRGSRVSLLSGLFLVPCPFREAGRVSLVPSGRGVRVSREGRVYTPPPRESRPLRRLLRILLECFLVRIKINQ